MRSKIARCGLVTMIAVCTAQAAELKPEAITAWKEYVAVATAKMERRLAAGGTFLDLDQDEASLRRVRGGQIIVSPATSSSPKKISAGIIHDWVGAAFIRDSKLNDVLSAIRNYDQYKVFYRPAVAESKTLPRDGARDRFSMVLVNNAGFLQIALETDYVRSYVSVDEHREYSISESTRIREIENYGAPGQRMLVEGEGMGLIWRLFSIARFEERDGGVYIEMEAIALSRDIPLSVKWFVEPIVRRISRNSLTMSLRQTASAVLLGGTITAHNQRGW